MTFDQVHDIVLTLAHLAVILFNVFGWIWRSTRKLHLFAICLTALSWFFLGIWFGWGYCFLTDWHWTVKRRLGEDHLPASFIKYFGDKITGMDLEVQLVDNVTLFTFLGAIMISMYLNIFRKTNTKQVS